MAVEILASVRTLIEVNPNGVWRQGEAESQWLYSDCYNTCRRNQDASEALQILRTKFFKKQNLGSRGGRLISEEEEEQEVNLFIRECPYEEPEMRSPSPNPYESIYSEPIYGGTDSSGGSSSCWTPTSSLYNYSTNNVSHPFSNPISTVFLNNTSINPPPPGPSPKPSFDLPPVLPPLPPSNTQPNKFSSIAKSAGRKLAKKLDYIRRLSKTSLDGISTEPLSLPVSPVTNQSSPSLYNASQSPSASGSCDGKIKRAISRPRIPPPAPPVVPPVKVPVANEKEDEDSDFCDSDSELIRNFVSAVQPIYSMEEEPLYQFYSYGISLQPEDDYQPVIPKNLGLTLEMLMPRIGQRTLWCEIPEVQSSGILGILSDKQKQLQESIFEILSSEVSYLKSLDVLISLFYENQDLLHVLTDTDRAALFGNIKEVKEAAKSFLAELLAKWEESWYIQDIGGIITENAKSRFGVYKEYCRNKPYQDSTLQRLRTTSDEFVSVVKCIEENKRCEMLRMDSFLMLPMQRITRLPLLVNAVLQRTMNAKEKGECEEALTSLTNLVIECNEAARESQDLEETGRIMEKLEFGRGLRPLRNPGQFVLKGDFMRNPFDTGGGGGSRGSKINWTFTKSKRTYFWLILFTQQLFISKKRSSGKLEVIEAIPPKDCYIKTLPSLEGISKDFQHYFMLHFEGREAIYFLAGRTASEVERWRTKLDELRSKKEEKVEAIFCYEAKREDELSFSVGEIINVNQKQPDGWYFGTKENGEEGWFPGNYAVET